MARGALDDPGDPREVRLGLLERAEVDQRVRRHRGVADPAEPVVPVPHAAQLLGERGGSGREDRARGLVAEGLEGERRTRDRLGLDAREAQRVRPVAPARLGGAAADLDRGLPFLEAVGARAHLDHQRPADLGEVDGGDGQRVLPVVLDVPFHALGAQADGLAAAEDLQALAADRLELHGQLPELRARRERELDGDLAVDLAHQDRGVEVAAAPRGGVEPVGDRQARPAGLHGHRAGHVALPERDAGVDRLHGEVPGVLAAEEVGEDRAGVRPRVAHPRDAPVGREQRVVGAVGEHGVAFDELRRFALEPGAAGVDEAREELGDVLGVADAVGRAGRAGPDAHADVRAMKMRKRILIGHVVAQEEDRGGPQLVAQLVERVALVGGDHRQVDDRLALGGLHAIPSGRTFADVFDGPHRVRLRRLPDVQRATGGLGLHPGALIAFRDRRQLGNELVAQPLVFATRAPG